MRIAIIGATGLVGRKILQVIEEQKLEISDIFLAGSESSVGKPLHFKNLSVKVISVSQVLSQRPDIALFSAGAEISKIWAPLFAKEGCFVVDNSSAWRMEKDIPLVVPEINPQTITKNTRIIANPNCSTIQMVMALFPLHQQFQIERIIVSTYQSITGTGKKAITQMENERQGIQDEMIYPHPIDKNCLPQCDIFVEDGYTKEEMKLINETRKIFADDTLKITATAVRVPVVGGHSESVTVSFKKDFSLEKIHQLLSAATGITVLDNPQKNLYPMPVTAEGKDTIFVGRIRRDFSAPHSLNLWIVADNLRKGAATNT
ncbi:MAG: aspartate-semialdehyde dehydrogenase, partial [Bacteroidales bacterium]|nr:aspartate-semialdehyde dehydrogenase [Bacteroidales bacterium]